MGGVCLHGRLHLCDILVPMMWISGDRNQSGDSLWGKDWPDGAPRMLWHEGNVLCLAGVLVKWVDTVIQTHQSRRLRSTCAFTLQISSEEKIKCKEKERIGEKHMMGRHLTFPWRNVRLLVGYKGWSRRDTVKSFPACLHSLFPSILCTCLRPFDLCRFNNCSLPSQALVTRFHSLAEATEAYANLVHSTSTSSWNTSASTTPQWWQMAFCW